MNLSGKIRKFLVSIFTINNSDDVSIEDAKNELDSQKLKLQDNLTQLYFQQGKLQEQRDSYESEAENLTSDLELAIDSGRDDLSLHLLEKIDTLKDQAQFINTQLTEIEDDIKTALQTRKELMEGEVKFNSTLESYQVRKSLLESQKNIKEQLGSIRSSSTATTTNKLAQKIHKLSAEIKTLKSANPLEKDLNEIRQKNSDKIRMKRLEELKNKHFGASVILAK